MTEREYKPKHFAVFSHEFDEGKSLQPRSYWDIKYGTPNNNMKIGSSLQMAHSAAGNEVERALEILCYIMDGAVERGKRLKLAEVQTVLGISREARMLPREAGY